MFIIAENYAKHWCYAYPRLLWNECDPIAGCEYTDHTLFTHERLLSYGRANINEKQSVSLIRKNNYYPKLCAH